MYFLSTSLRKRSQDEKESFIIVRQLVLISFLSLSALGLLAAPVPSNKPTTYPAWWFARGVITQTNPTNNSPSWPTNYPASDDYAVINQGQLKNMALQAYNELQAYAPTYIWSTSYGTNLTTMVGWNPANGDAYAAVNLGQLKTVAAPFYNILIQMGYTNNYPWTGVHADDYAAANIGQAKNLFSFDVGNTSDGDGVPDWWEMEYFGQIGTNATNSINGNGLTLLQDYQQGNNPTNYYSQGGTNIAPVISITGGNNQSSIESTFAPQPLAVQVANSSGTPLTNAPVTFAVTSGAGSLSYDTTPLGATNLLVNTDTNGQAQVYFEQPAGNNLTNQISATTGGQSVNFTQATEVQDGTLASVTGLTVTPTGPGTMTVTWVNQASNAQFIIVQQSSDGANWTTVANLTNTTAASYTATGLTQGQNYSFRVTPAIQQ